MVSLWVFCFHLLPRFEGFQRLAANPPDIFSHAAFGPKLQSPPLTMAPIPAAERFRVDDEEHTTNESERKNPLLARPCERISLGAGLVRIVLELQERVDRVDIEAELARMPNERQPVNVARGLQAPLTRGPFERRKQPHLLVIANCRALPRPAGQRR